MIIVGIGEEQSDLLEEKNWLKSLHIHAIMFMPVNISSLDILLDIHLTQLLFAFKN